MQIKYHFKIKHGNQLITELLANNILSLTEIEERLGLSRRSIFYLIKRLNNELASYGLDEIETIRKIGYHLPNSTCQQLQSNQVINNSLHQLENGNFFYPDLSQKQRRYLILFTLITRSNTSLNRLSNFFKVSKNTIITDLSDLQKKLPDNLHIVNTAKGKQLTGDEQTIRRWVFANITQIAILFGEHFVPKSQKQNIIKQLQLLEQITGNNFTDDSLHLLVVFIFWLTDRLQQHHACIMNDTSQNQTNYSLTFTWAQSYLLNWNITSSKEAHFLDELVNSLAFQNVRHDNPMIKKLQPVAKAMIQRFNDITGVNLPISHGRLLDNLTIHLISAYYRLVHHISYKNPLLKKIKNNYQETFEITQAAIQPFKHFVKKKISPDEIALITVYFSVALHNLQTPQSTLPGVLVVCSSGIGTSELLISQLRHHYPTINFIGPYNVLQYENNQLVNVQLVLSTIKLPRKIGSCPVVQLPVIPSSSDWLRIDHSLINANVIKKQLFSKVNSNTLMDIVANYARIVDPQGLKKAFHHYLQQINEERLQKATSYIPSQHFTRYISKAMDWEEALHYSLADLEKHQIVYPHYCKRIIELTKNHGPYMALGKGVFLAHATPNSGVRHLGFSFTYFACPFSLPNSTEKINFVVSIAPIDQQQHLRLLAILFQCLQNKQWLSALHAVHSRTALQKVLKDGHLI